jgi:hypothetical protein
MHGSYINFVDLSRMYIPPSVVWIAPNAFFNLHPDFTIFGVPGSYAQDYAQQNNIPFVEWVLS